MALGGMNGGKVTPWRGKPKAKAYGVKSATSAQASPRGKIAIRLQTWEVRWKEQAPWCIAGVACRGSWATVWNWYPTSTATATLTIKSATMRQVLRARLENTKLAFQAQSPSSRARHDGDHPEYRIMPSKVGER